MGQRHQSHPFPRHIPVFSLTCLLQSSLPSDRWPGMRLPLQMLIFWPAVNNTRGIISLQNPSALSLLGGTKLKGREVTKLKGGECRNLPGPAYSMCSLAREMLGASWCQMYQLHLGQPLKVDGVGFSWRFFFSKSRDKIKKSFLGW